MAIYRLSSVSWPDTIASYRRAFSALVIMTATADVSNWGLDER